MDQRFRKRGDVFVAETGFNRTKLNVVREMLLLYGEKGQI